LLHVYKHQLALGGGAKQQLKHALS
jgi:hypothetical protein